MLKNTPKTGQDGTENGAKTGREANRTRALDETLPPGIKLRYREGRAKPFCVRFGPDRKEEAFALESERNDRAEQLAFASREHGAVAINYDPVEWRAYSDFCRQSGANLELLKKTWALHGHSVKPSMLLADAVESYIAKRLKEKIREKTDTFSHVRLHLKDRLSGKFGGLPIGSVTTKMLRDHLDSFAFQPVNEKNHLKAWAAFFSRAVLEKWIAESPCLALIPPRVDKKKRKLLSVRETFDFLKGNLKEPIAPKLALEMFGLMRCSAVERVEKEHVRFGDRSLFMPDYLHKSGEGQLRQKHPAVLWSWLELATEATWEKINYKNYDEEKAEAFIRSGVISRKNVLRSSGISYLISATGELGKASYLAQHTSIAMTKTYQGAATYEDAMLWLQLTPANVAKSWDQFLATAKPYADTDQSTLRTNPRAPRSTRGGKALSPDPQGNPGGVGSGQEPGAVGVPSFEGAERAAASSERHAANLDSCAVGGR